jgi:hypothetical protein
MLEPWAVWDCTCWRAPPHNLITLADKLCVGDR